MLWIRAFILLCGLLDVSICGFAQEMTLSQAEDLLRQASKLVPEIPEIQQMSVASNVANAQARAGDLQGALATVYLLKKPQDQAQALGSIAYSIDYSGNLDGALKLMESAAKGQSRDVGYVQIAMAHARRGDFRGAVRIAHLIRNDRFQLIEALDAIAAEAWKSANHEAAQQNWAEALELAQQRSGEDPSLEFFLNGIAVSHAQAGDKAGALQIIDQTRFSAEQRQPSDDGSLSIVASSLIQAGELEQALDIVKTLPSGSNRDINLMVGAIELMKKDDVADAKEVAAGISDAQLKAEALQGIALAETNVGRPATAIETVESIPDLARRADKLASLAFVQAQHDDNAASDTLRRALASANAASPKPPDYVFATIAVTQAMLGDFETAEQTVRRLPPDARWWAWQNLTGMLVSSGDVDAAMKLAASETNAHPKACALLGAANAILAQLHQHNNAQASGKNQ